MLRLQLVDSEEWVLACASSSVLGKWSDTLRDRLGTWAEGLVHTQLSVRVGTWPGSPCSPATAGRTDPAPDSLAP